MKHFLLFLLTPLLLLLSTDAAAQVKPVTVTLKVAERSGLFKMGGPRFIRLTLSTKNSEDVLTSENVGAGQYYYFLLQNEGDWKVDVDFLKDNLPLLALAQDSAKLHPDYCGEIIANGESTFVLIGFPKTFALNRPFAFEFPIDDAVARTEVTIPEECWPGYAKVTKYFGAGSKALQDGNYKEAVSSFNTILEDPSLTIFPVFSDARGKRLEAFQKYFDEKSDSLAKALSGTDLKLKIAASSDAIDRFQYVVDSLTDQAAGITSSDAAISALADKAKASIQRSRVSLDSLRQALDDFNVRWIIAGSSGTKIEYKYKYVIEALADAFASLNFQDSTSKELQCSIPDELMSRLKKYNLDESYETFIRIVNDRWKKGMALFPPEFIINLRRDTAQFPLPYYSVLKAVNDFYSLNYATAKVEIFQVMKTSYDHDLTGRMDDLRVLIDSRLKRTPNEVLAHMTDGATAEEKGNTDGAAEHYRDAMLIADDYAPASFALGKLYDRTGDVYKANNFFQKAVSTDTLYYSAYRFLYMNYFKNANFKPMIDLLTQALAHGNDFYDIHYNLGIAYNGAALYEDAIKQYERALELNDRSVEANIQAGIAYQNMKSYAKAREYYTRAIQIDPENQTATENLKRLDDLQKKF
ncbi:MAG TPA: tetratricopeptide repeat protein [Bacteroidota bacterium]|nr:tetratricopeptide repeat protein [Bacteroidota bacterium]